MCAFLFFCTNYYLGKCVCVFAWKFCVARIYLRKFCRLRLGTFIHIYIEHIECDMWLLMTGLSSAYFNFNYITMFVHIWIFCGVDDWHGNGAVRIVFCNTFIFTYFCLYHMFQWWFAFLRMLIDVQVCTSEESEERKREREYRIK